MRKAQDCSHLVKHSKEEWESLTTCMSPIRLPTRLDLVSFSPELPLLSLPSLLNNKPHLGEVEVRTRSRHTYPCTATQKDRLTTFRGNPDIVNFTVT